MTTLHGRAIVVTDEPIGSHLSAAAAAAATTIYVDDASAFVEAGGDLTLDDGEGTDETVAYTAVDYETGEITCAALANAWDAGDIVTLSPAQTQRFVTIEPDDSDLGTVLARVPYSMQPMLAEGIRDTNEGEEVVLKIERGQWVVSDVLRTTPVVDGAYVSLVAEQVTATHIEAGAITADKLATDLVISSTIKTATEGQRVELDEDGVRLISADDDIMVELPTATGEDAIFQGEIVASDLTVDNATFRGATDYDVGSSLTLAGSQVPPATAPTVTQGVVTGEWPNPGGTLDSPHSPWYWADEDDVVYVTGTPSSTQFVARQNAATGALVDYVLPDFPAEFYLHSIVWHEENARWIGTARKEASNEWFIVQWGDNASAPGYPGTYQDRWSITVNPNAFPILTKADGSGTFYIAYTNSSGWLIVNTYSWSAAGAAPTITNTAVDTSPTEPSDKGVVAFYRGSADFGANRNVVRLRDTVAGAAGSYSVFSESGSTLTEQTTSSWFCETDAWGLWYDDSLFHEMSRSEQEWVTYSGWTETASNTYQVAYTWFDTTGTEHETIMSPRTARSHLSRRYLTVTWPSIPTGGAEDPDSVRVYVKDSDSDPGLTFSDYYLQGEVANPALSTTLSSYSTGTAGSKGTDFSAGTPALIDPSSGTGYTDGLHGDGDGFIPIGSVTMWAGPYNEMPPGWLLCDGQAVSRTTYDKLHAILKDVGGADSYAWGSGNGTTTFNVPNFEAKFPLGVIDTSPASAATSTGSTHSNPGDHTHGAGTLATADHNQAVNTTTGGGGTRTTTANHNITGSTGSNGGHAHDSHAYTMLPYLGIVFIIKADHV